MKKILWRRAVKTRRLVIRPYEPSDYEVWSNAYRGRLKKQNAFDPGPIPEKDLTKSIYRKKVAKHKKVGDDDFTYIYGIFNRKTGENLGTLDFFIITRQKFQWGNLGYQLHNQYWGHGYAKEAAKAGLKIAFEFLHLHRIEAAMEPHHKASLAIAKSLGMTCEGRREKFFYDGKRWLDMKVFTKLAPR